MKSLNTFQFATNASHYFLEIRQFTGNHTAFETLYFDTPLRKTTITTLPWGDKVTANSTYQIRVRTRNDKPYPSYLAADALHPTYLTTAYATIFTIEATKLFDPTMSPLVSVIAANVSQRTLDLGFQHSTAGLYRVEALDGDGGGTGRPTWRLLAEVSKKLLSGRVLM